MLELKICIKETCDGLQFIDRTRNYSEENPTGYGVENGVTGPADFGPPPGSYTFNYWDASLDPATDDPTFTYDLLQNVPAQSPDEDYRWETFTFEQMGVSSTAQGIAYFEIVATKDGDTYLRPFTALLIQDLTAAVAEKMKAWKPGCKCADGCLPAIRLAEAVDSLRCGWDCDEDAAKDIIKWIKANVNTCC